MTRKNATLDGKEGEKDGAEAGQSACSAATKRITTETSVTNDRGVELGAAVSEGTKVEVSKSSQTKEAFRHFLASLAGSLTGKLVGGLPFRGMVAWFHELWLRD